MDTEKIAVHASAALEPFLDPKTRSFTNPEAAKAWAAIRVGDYAAALLILAPLAASQTNPILAKAARRAEKACAKIACQLA